jgi:nitroreductase
LLSTWDEPMSAGRKVGAVPLSLLFDRRSSAALVDPGPTDEQLRLLLLAAATVPDHGSVRPWRLVVVHRDGQDAFGEALAASARERQVQADPESVEGLRRRAYAAPVQLVVIASPNRGSSVREWEQIACASCTGLAVALAAHALGLGASWKSVPFTRTTALAALLALSDDEHLLGWINVGSRADASVLRPTCDPGMYASELRGSTLRPFPKVAAGLNDGLSD